jgi:hypothetical protein
MIDSCPTILPRRPCPSLLHFSNHTHALSSVSRCPPLRSRCWPLQSLACSPQMQARRLKLRSCRLEWRQKRTNLLKKKVRVIIELLPLALKFDFVRFPTSLESTATNVQLPLNLFTHVLALLCHDPSPRRRPMGAIPFETPTARATHQRHLPLLSQDDAPHPLVPVAYRPSSTRHLLAWSSPRASPPTPTDPSDSVSSLVRVLPPIRRRTQ